ncbi:MAG: cobalt ECF transporter T component CbiQ [Candidatus Omnitrophota bacterium]
MDPRFKAITFTVFLLLVLLARSIALIGSLYLFCLILVLLSRINLLFFLKRTWVFIPIFAVFIGMPALFANITPGEPVFALKVFGASLIITRPGVLTFSLFVLRVATSVSFVVLLVLATRHTHLLKVLRVFKVPLIFVTVLSMCYRYIYLFVELIENTYLAIKSRSIGRLHYKKGQKVAVLSIANLWQRSFQLNEEVYSAMLSRGYSGEPLVMDEFKARPSDCLWLLFVLLFCGCIIYLNYIVKV